MRGIYDLQLKNSLTLFKIHINYYLNWFCSICRKFENVKILLVGKRRTNMDYYIFVIKFADYSSRFVYFGTIKHVFVSLGEYSYHSMARNFNSGLFFLTFVLISRIVICRLNKRN